MQSCTSIGINLDLDVTRPLIQAGGQSCRVADFPKKLLKEKRYILLTSPLTFLAQK